MKGIILPHKCEFSLMPLDMNPMEARCRFCGKSIADVELTIELKPQKPLEFVKYRSVHNMSRAKIIKAIKAEFHDQKPWVAVNKYHGANFQLMASAEEVIACSRERIIEPAEDFNSHRAMMPYLTARAKEIQSYFGVNISIFFEIFGGSYPHPDVPKINNFSRVAKGVWYCPFVDVRVIDIKVDEEFLDWDEMCEISYRYGLEPAKELARGSFDELIELDPEFEDPTYLEYNLPKIDGNISEGYVLRPLKDVYFNNGRRVIVKKKSKKFAEKKQASKAPRPQMVLSETELEALNNLSACITENRLNNIMSHGDSYTYKDFPMLQGLFVQDILKEEAEEDYIEALDKAEKKRIVKILYKEVSEFIRPFFLDKLSDF